MIALLIAVLIVVLPLLHLAFSKVPRTPQRVVHILLLTRWCWGRRHRLADGFHFPCLFPRSGGGTDWLAPSPFQLEVGVHDGAWVFSASSTSGSAVCSGSRPGSAWSFFMLGATYGHIRETVIREDYAPYNFFTMFSDGFIGI
jgi:hypothetical protein